MDRTEFEVCVVGGGPAGCATAIRLANLGHQVCLVERSRFPRPHVGESLSPGIWPVLDIVGLRDAVLKEPFVQTRETLIDWAEDRVERIVSTRQLDRGVLIDRGRFDALLIDAASTAGVAVFQPARLNTSTVLDGSWRLDLTMGGRTRPIRANFVVDAAGRSGWLPGNRKRMSPHTTALCGYLPAQRCPQTLVEATFDGWIWGAPIPGSLFSAMVFLDSRLLRDFRLEGVEAIWRSRLAKSGLFHCFSELPVVGAVIARDTTTYCALEPIGSCFVKVGEASFSLDPLSSTGVEKAMFSGLTAATVVHTMILWPDRRDLCTRYYLDRQTECMSAQVAWSSGFYSSVKRFADFPFWRVRSAGTSSAPPETKLTVPVRAGKVNLASTVRIAESVCLRTEPCIVDDEIRACAVLSHPHLDRPVAFLDGVEVSRLLEIVPYCQNLGSLLAICSLRFTHQKSQRIVAWLLDNDILEEVL